MPKLTHIGLLAALLIMALPATAAAANERFFLRVEYEVSEEGEGVYAEHLPLEEGATKEKVHVLFVGKLEREVINEEDEVVEEEEVTSGPYAIPEGVLENVLVSTPEVTPYEVGGAYLMTGELDGAKSVTLAQIAPLNQSPSRFEFFYSWGAL